VGAPVHDAARPGPAGGDRKVAAGGPAVAVGTGTSCPGTPEQPPAPCQRRASISDIVAGVRVMVRPTAAVMVAVALAGCARPEHASGSERVTVVVSASAAAAPGVAVPMAPVSPGPAPPRSGEAACARDARPAPAVNPSASFNLDDPGERARRALAQQDRPVPRRGALPESAVPGAEACVRALEIHFSLLMRGSGIAPSGPAIGAALTSAGLTGIVVGDDASFVASTGAACVHGAITRSGPSFVIGPVTVGGSCAP
jgi:hypothetical protein